MSSRRLFFALWPDRRVREQIQGAAFPRLKPHTTPPENWHMTLVFLGPTSGDQQSGFEQAAASVDAEPFQFSLDINGYFPKARVAWLGCQHPPDPLLRLQADLEGALRVSCPRHPAFFDQRNRYRPHLTLYRNIRKKNRARCIDPINWQVNEFCLVESRPSERPVYRILDRWVLKTS